MVILPCGCPLVELSFDVTAVMNVTRVAVSHTEIKGQAGVADDGSDRIPITRGEQGPYYRNFLSFGLNLKSDRSR